MLVYIVIVNWNRKQDTLECLESLTRLFYSNCRILVVDNGSEDGSPQAIAQKFPHIEQIVNPHNIGFSRGYNLGMRHALASNAGGVFILNNDTIVDENCLSILAEQIRPDTGILAPVIYFHNHPGMIWSAGGRTNRLTLEKHDHLQGKSKPSHWPVFIERDFVPGCAMFFPRHMLEHVGLFDEGFYLYYEDSDYCLRVRQQGFHVLVVPQATVRHKVASSSGGKDTPNERYWMARSSVRYFRKHASAFQTPFIIFWRTGSAIRTTLKLAVRSNWPAVQAYWCGLRDGLRDTTARNP